MCIHSPAGCPDVNRVISVTDTNTCKTLWLMPIHFQIVAHVSRGIRQQSIMQVCSCKPGFQTEFLCLLPIRMHGLVMAHLKVLVAVVQVCALLSH